MYEERVYRAWTNTDDLLKTEVREKETDLLILAKRDLGSEAKKSVHKYRSQIEGFIKICPDFKTSLEPRRFNSHKGRSPIIDEMIKASKTAGVGPMAAVAGAMAEFVGRDLMEYSKEVIVENGGDIFMASRLSRTFGIFAGNSPLTGKLSFEIIFPQVPLGICTSSGMVGHSLSFGKADAVIIISDSTALADAAATACANLVKDQKDIKKTIDFARSNLRVLAVIVIIDDKVGSWGRRGFKWSLKN